MPFQLKEIYNQQFFSTLCQSLTKSYPKFSEQKFLALIFDDQWQKRELKQRMRHISHCLNQSLTNSYPQNIQILKQTAADFPQEKMSGLALVIFADYVETFGLEDFSTSINALEFFTEFGSAEFAIRHFLVKYEKPTLKQMLLWAKSKNHHIRRLASEGCRPRLPWGIALAQYKKDPTKILPILEILKDDQEEYARRSVANNLNDIAKDHPEIALDLAQKWLKNADENLTRLVKHGLRGLLKKGDQRALRLFAIHSDHGATIELFAIKFDLQKNLVKVGENLSFSFRLINQKKNKIRLEYAIYFLMKNGQYSKKIFQIVQKNLDEGKFIFNKKHSFRVISTRKYYSGEHRLGLVLNGVEIETKIFNLFN
ncbi:MAG: DNA alkylation repair protein [Pseudomonadota bacterium]